MDEVTGSSPVESTNLTRCAYLYINTSEVTLDQEVMLSTLQDVMKTTSLFCQQNKEAFAISGDFQATHHARVNKVLVALVDEQGVTIEQADMIPFETELGAESARLYEDLLAWQKSPTED